MGLIDKIRSSLPIPGRSFRHPERAQQLVAVVLLERPTTADELVALVATVPGATARPGTSEPATRGSATVGSETAPERNEAATEAGGSAPVEVTLAGAHGFLLALDTPVPDGEAEASAANNPFWPEGAEQVARHRAHVVVSLSNADADEGPDLEEDTRHTRTYAAFAHLVAGLLGHPDALGVYLGDQGVVYQPSFYIEAVNDAGDGLPWEVAWFTWAAWESEGVSCGSTHGLRVFGHEELEIRGSTELPSTVMDMLANVASYVVESGAVLLPGETLGYTDDQKLTIIAVEGSFVDGHAQRIGLP